MDCLENQNVQIVQINIVGKYQNITTILLTDFTFIIIWKDMYRQLLLLKHKINLLQIYSNYLSKNSKTAMQNSIFVVYDYIVGNFYFPLNPQKHNRKFLFQFPQHHNKYQLHDIPLQQIAQKQRELLNSMLNYSLLHMHFPTIGYKTTDPLFIVGIIIIIKHREAIDRQGSAVSAPKTTNQPASLIFLFSCTDKIQYTTVYMSCPS